MIFHKKKSLDLEEKGSWLPQRYVFGILGFFALSNAYIQRFNLSLTITEMTPPIYHPSNTSTDAHRHTLKKYDFDWDEQTQGLILSSVFWGYVISMIPGGMVSERYGGKHTLGFGMLCSSLSTFFTPLVIQHTNFYGLIVMRVLIGLGQGPIYPALNVILSQWAPMHERCRLGALVFAGAQVGNVISMALTGIILRELQWPSVFYIYGLLGLVWYILWFIFVSDSPATHRFISEKERKYLADTVVDVTDERCKLPLTPWIKIITSAPVWGLIVAQVGHDWGLFTIITDLPKYMKQVLRYSVAENGVLSALPYLSMWISALVCGVLCDWLVKKRGYDVTIVRKTFVTIAATGPAIGTLIASYAEYNRTIVIASFTGGMALMGAFVPSLKVNPLDLSPNYAGSLMAVVGCVGAISGILAPQLVGFMTTHGTLEEWRNVFWVSFVMLVSTNIVFVLLGSGKVQPFNELIVYSEDDYQPDAVTEKSHYPGTNFSMENEKETQSRRPSTIIDGMPIDPTRRPSVFVVRPLIK